MKHIAKQNEYMQACIIIYIAHFAHFQLFFFAYSGCMYLYRAEFFYIISSRAPSNFNFFHVLC
jgi:hypothetical protein